MSDFKSKLPDLNELTSMTAKLFKGIKTSVSEIIQDYKQKEHSLLVPKRKPQKISQLKARPNQKQKARPLKTKLSQKQKANLNQIQKKHRKKRNNPVLANK